MRRHEFQPGRLIAGLALMTAGVLYLLDSGGEADVPWFAVVPIALGGLSLAALTGMVGYALRRDRRDRIRESSDR
ncbi:hypothetical protein AMK16_11115 [Streptomyces sp. CB00455]|uniref:hypothetical protein n=1 Tax=Streptomyces sp. CB00455 TaxID=1703927 RepID=UPI00093B33EE|nr:hypothetical protein [Streptomyces sp. CB00455]OKK20938.1 hypothetical protein AMK16_11115 [Streptomyces sp. CB00455]